jgi:glutaminyl-tRNA synthetase
MAVLDPLKVTIANYEGDEQIEASYYPDDVPKNGSRKVPFSREIYIERDDFCENPPKGYYRLTPNQPVRLKHAYIIKCEEFVKDANGNIIEIIAQYYPDSKSGQDKSGIKVQSAIQWVEAKNAKQIEVRLYDRLYKNPMPQGVEDLNPNSLQIIKNALIEPAVITQKPDERFQFERQGYFYADPIDYSDENPVFNKIVGLKDSWNKKDRSRAPKAERKPQSKKVQIDGEVEPMNADEQKLFDKYTNKLKLNATVADILARDEKLSSFYADAILVYDSPVAIANLVANEVARELKEKEIGTLRFSAHDIARLVQMVDEGTISTKIAKEVFEMMAKSEEKGLIQISDPALIEPLIDEVIANNPQNVQKFKEGNNKLFGFFVGQVLKATQGKANPQVVNELVAKKLEG